MEKIFEYKITQHYESFTLESILNQEGNMGWELVSIVTDGYKGCMYKLFWKKQNQ